MTTTYHESRFSKATDAATRLTQYSAEASDLQLPPGQWPQTVRIERDGARPLTLWHTGLDRNGDGDITLMCYRCTEQQPDGSNRLVALSIFND